MSIPYHSPAEWGILVCAAVIIGFSKTGLPGTAILSIPLAALVLPAKASTGIILPMLIAGDLFAVTFYRRSAQWAHLGRLLPWAVGGIVIGWWLLGIVTDAQLRPIIGSVSLVMLGLWWWREKGRGAPAEGQVRRHWSFAPGMGLLAGIATMMANAAGPIMTIYLVAMKLPKREFIGTVAWYFFIVNCIKVPFSASLGLITGKTLLFNMMLVPGVMAGAVIGISIANRLPERQFAGAVQAVAALASIRLLY